MSAKEDGHWGFLKAPLIQKIINMMWFANKHDDRVVFHTYFKPFSYPALALVLAAIECCIDEGGEKEWISLLQYKSTMVHTSCISNACMHFEDATKLYNILPAICMRLYETGCIHSSAGPLSAPTKVTVSAHVITTTIREYEDGSTMEDESD
ncbi:hypothetical protein EDC04DRAFT_2607657 [Pisolithus marmoratus]|nr:hypothetical protein EDC04DRAFT_2607657 [Pisolithus marmoratus]